VGQTSDTVSLFLVINKESNLGGIFFKIEFPMHRSFIFDYTHLQKVDQKHLESSEVWC
jgi:hypothetical protein